MNTVDKMIHMSVTTRKGGVNRVLLDPKRFPKYKYMVGILREVFRAEYFILFKIDGKWKTVSAYIGDITVVQEELSKTEIDKWNLLITKEIVKDRYKQLEDIDWDRNRLLNDIKTYTNKLIDNA